MLLKCTVYDIVRTTKPEEEWRMAPKIQASTKTLAHLRKLTGTTPAAHALRRTTSGSSGHPSQQLKKAVLSLRAQSQVLDSIQTADLVAEIVAAARSITAFQPIVFLDFFAAIRAKQSGSLTYIVLAAHMVKIFSTLPSAGNLLEGSAVKNVPSDSDESHAVESTQTLLQVAQLFEDASVHLRRSNTPGGIAALTALKRNMELPEYQSVPMQSYLYALLSETANGTLFLPRVH